MCEAAYEPDAEYRRLAESPLSDSAVIEQDDKPEWWQLYEIDLYNHRPVMAWMKPLLLPSDPTTAFANSAKALYALAGVTEAEAAALLLYHEGYSFRRIANRLERDVKTIFERIKAGEAKLARLENL